MHDLDHVDGNASAYYFTLQTGKHDIVELWSFLYLDLANSSVKSIAGQMQCSRQQTSHRQKTSVLSWSTSWTFSHHILTQYNQSAGEQAYNTWLSKLQSSWVQVRDLRSASVK
ncbi:hypothetical protein F5141DRAFT_1062849 [Pisolithus sp. B1]|nr:hypothetical protein F5141DRAFT_1062849 [Pisolithus sp. B1]